MRNLKKVLSLVLCMAMMLSIMVVGAGAAFSDQEKIVNTEAVDVCAALNIINGYTDGSFRPEGTITRAEACKMICVALNGGKEPVLGTNATATFTDIKGHWAEKYIEYCVSLGVVAGIGGGKFNPNGNVTGSQFAKMLLIGLGYNAKHAEFLGNAWEVNVNVVASAKGLYADLAGMDPSVALTRDNAAQMVWNALDAVWVEYEYTLVTDENGQLTSQIVVKDNKNDETLLEDKYGAVKVEGVVTANEFTSGSTMKGKTTIAAITNTAEVGNKVAGTTYKVETGAAELGKSITMYVKPASTNTASQNAVVLGGAIVNDNNNVFVTGEKLVNNSAKSNDITKVLKDAGLKFEDGVTVTTYVNYASVGTATNAATNVVNYLAADGVESQYIDNDNDGKVDVTIFVKKSFGQVSTVSTAGDGKLAVANLGANTVSLSTSDAKEDVADFETLNLAKDDYVSFIKVADTYYVEKVNGVTATVTAKKGVDADCEITADGVVYTKSALASAADMSAAAGNQDYLDVAVSLGKEAVLYLDDYNNVIYVDSVSADDPYLMITALDSYDTFGGTLKAKVVRDDGTTGTISIASYNNGTATIETDTLYVKASIASGTEAAAGAIRGNDGYKQAINVYGGEYFTKGKALQVNDVCTYTVDSDGNYELKVTNDTNTTASIVKGNAKSISGKTLDAGTVFVVKTGSNWTTYTGIGNVPSLNSSTVYYVFDAATDVVDVVFVEADDADTLNNTVVILDKSPVETDDDGDTVYTFNVIYKGVVGTLTANVGAKNAIVGNASEGLYTGATISNGKITNAGSFFAYSEVTGCKDNVITTIAAAGSTTSVTSYTYDNNTKVFVVEDGVATEGTIADITVKDTNVTPNIAGSNVVIVARGDNSATDGTKFIADYIVVYE